MTRRIAYLTAPLRDAHARGLVEALLDHAGLSLSSGLLIEWTTPEEAAAALAAYQPHFIVIWERYGHILRSFLGHKGSIDDWRGSVFVSAPTSPYPGVKCLSTYHPERLRMEMELSCISRFDMRKVALESRTDEVWVPQRNIEVCMPSRMTADEVCARMDALRLGKITTALDIEGGCGYGVACIGFATSATEAVVVPFYGVDGISIWSEEDEVKIWTAVAAYLEAPECHKILQNALYELFVLAWTLGIIIEGIVDDTMLKHFEIYCEMEKALEVQASIYTRQPFWKLNHRKIDGRYVPFRDGKPITSEEWFNYNAIDCCVTWECSEAQQLLLKPQQLEHYHFNMSLLLPIVYMMLRGLRFDREAAQKRLAEVQQEIYELQDQINQEAAKSSTKVQLRQFFHALAVGVEYPVEGESVGSSPTQGVETANMAGCGQMAVPPNTSNTPVEAVSGGAVATDTGGSEASGEVSEVGGGFATQPQVDNLSAVRPHQEPSTLGRTNGELVGVGTRNLNMALLLPLLTSAFCQARRLEKREVKEVWWQPMRWNGKKWVKGGKRVSDAYINIPNHPAFGPENYYQKSPGDKEPVQDICPGSLWAKPITKTVTRNFEVEIKALEDVERFVLDSKNDACRAALRILRKLRSSSEHRACYLSPAQRGELATLLGIGLKINASGRDEDEEQEDGTVERGEERDANWFLYEHCRLPKQYIKEGNANTDRLASDAKAVILAWIASGKTEETRDPRAVTFIRLKRLLTETKSLKVEPDQDGRIRCSLNLVGTPTHRIACSKSPTGTSRLNMQTVTKKHRQYYPADDGCLIGQYDLAGADGWTTAAYSKMLGDDTMLEDLRYKLKPAQIVVLMLDGGEAINRIPRAELKELCKDITEDKDYRYFSMKKVVHGSSYKSGKRTVSNGIAVDSYKATGKPIYFSPADCEKVQHKCFFVRYPGIVRYQEWVLKQLQQSGMLTASNGFCRRFYGRKNDPATHRAALAQLPQVYTTYTTCLALAKLWSDPENRREDGNLIVEPLLTVHDSLVEQWRTEDTEFAHRKNKEWFNNPIQIANETLVIPVSGTCGPSWGEQH